MAEEGSEESKPHEPTRKKLETARRKGDIPRSTDLTATVSYAGVLVAGLVAGGAIASGLGEIGTALIAKAHTLARLFFDGHGAPPAAAVLVGTGSAIAPLFGLPIAMVIAMLVATKGIVVAPDKLAPKLSRISPWSNAKQKFGASGLFEFAKSFVKLLVFSAAVAIYLSLRVEELVLAATRGPQQNAVAVGWYAAEFLAIVVAISGVIAAIDWLWQVADHRRRNRMSHKELRDELKETEGDPMLKDKRRQRGLSIAQNAMMADVPEASVIVVNPTHYAVALKWEMGDRGAPICLAKGVDQIALRIREAGTAAGVPIRDDPPTARLLYATVEIGAEISPEHYAQVAAAIRFAEAVRTKAKASLL